MSYGAPRRAAVVRLGNKTHIPAAFFGQRCNAFLLASILPPAEALVPPLLGPF